MFIDVIYWLITDYTSIYFLQAGRMHAIMLCYINQRRQSMSVCWEDYMCLVRDDRYRCQSTHYQSVVSLTSQCSIWCFRHWLNRKRNLSTKIFMLGWKYSTVILLGNMLHDALNNSFTHVTGAEYGYDIVALEINFSRQWVFNMCIMYSSRDIKSFTLFGHQW